MRLIRLAFIVLGLGIWTFSAQTQDVGNPLLDNIHRATLEDVQQWVKLYSIHEFDRWGDLPLHNAARGNNNPAVTEFLLMQGLDVDIRDKKDGTTPLMSTGGAGNNPVVIDVLMAHGADIHARDNDGNTALMYAAERALYGGTADNTIPMIARLLSHDADIFATDNDGKTALDHAKGPIDEFHLPDPRYKSGQDPDPIYERQQIIEFLESEMAKRKPQP